MVHEFVIDIGFPMQETVTNHPTHEAEGTKITIFCCFSIPNKWQMQGKIKEYSLSRFFFARILLKPLLELLDGLPSETGQARIQHQLKVHFYKRFKLSENLPEPGI